jgi:hypothetical protein
MTTKARASFAVYLYEAAAFDVVMFALPTIVALGCRDRLGVAVAIATAMYAFTARDSTADGAPPAPMVPPPAVPHPRAPEFWTGFTNSRTVDASGTPVACASQTR